jgi:hypothetical protein
MRLCRGIPTRSFAATSGWAYTQGSPLPRALGRRMPHASSPPRARASSHLAPLSGRPGRIRHRRGLGSCPADRPSSAPPLAAGWSGRSLPLLRPVRGSYPEARGIRHANRLGPPQGAPDLGSWPNPRDVAPPTPEPIPARGTDAAAMVPPSRARPGTGGATSRRRLPASRTAPPDLADGRGRVGETADRSAHLLAADRRRVQRRGPVDRSFPPGAGGLKSRQRRSKPNSARPSAAGAAQSGSGWTTACRGARGVTCRPTWRCG